MNEEEKILQTIRFCANDYQKQEDGIQCFEWGDLWILNEYIKKLQQENKRLQDEVDDLKWCIKGLRERIDKVVVTLKGEK